MGAELARLIEEEHSAARTCDRPGTGGTRAAADEGAHARRVVRRFERRDAAETRDGESRERAEARGLYRRVVVQEGKFHQVKRMCAAVGLKVGQLHRRSIGSVVLDDGLEPGQFRPLTDEEREALRSQSR